LERMGGSASSFVFISWHSKLPLSIELTSARLGANCFRKAGEPFRKSSISAVNTGDLVLNSHIRLEVYYNIGIKDLLKYMIIFNTAQKRMSLNHQLEIMQHTILQNLEKNHGAVFFTDKSPGTKKNKFNGADLIMAIQAFLEKDHMLTKTSSTDSLFWNLKDDEDVVDEKLEEISKAMGLVTNKLHPLVIEFYENTEEPKYMNILPNSTATFLVPMLASLGRFVEKEKDNSLIVKSVLRLIGLYKKMEDVFQLESYYSQIDLIKTSRSKTIRNMTEFAFRQFWYSPHDKTLDWSYARKGLC
jgi:hypothetical protein